MIYPEVRATPATNREVRRNISQVVITGLSAFPSVDALWFIIHGCLCVRSQASYCHLNQISISTSCDSAAAHSFTHKLWPLSLPAFQTSSCVFSDYACYLFSQMRPADQMANGLSCPSYSNPLPQVPNGQTSSSTSPSFSQPTHPQAARCTRTFSHSCILTNMLKILACPHPDDHIFLWPDLQVFVQAAETIYVLQALPICSTTSLWAAPIMGPVCDRDGWEPRGAHKTCSREGTLEGGREGKEWTAGASSSLSRLGRTLEDSVRRANCCPLHHQSSTNPKWTSFTLPPWPT